MNEEAELLISTQRMLGATPEKVVEILSTLTVGPQEALIIGAMILGLEKEPKTVSLIIEKPYGSFPVQFIQRKKMELMEMMVKQQTRHLLWGQTTLIYDLSDQTFHYSNLSLWIRRHVR